MPSDPAAALSSLLRAAEIEDHEEVVKAANAALAADRDDLVAQRTKVVALLKLDRFDDALRLIDGHGDKLRAACVVETAYALYKAGKLDEATGFLASAAAAAAAAAGGESGAGARSLRHIAAQVAYRAERFDEAGHIYRQLLASDPAGEESDLGINASAAAAQAEWQRALLPLPPPLSRAAPPQETQGTAETFEACFNLASGETARGNLARAAALLQRASILCDNSDELGDDEKQAELRPIQAQQAYVLAKLGKLDEARDTYQSLAPFRESDGKDFEVVAQNNLLALEPPGANPYLRQRINDALLASVAAAKLFAHQSAILDQNKLVTDLAAKKIDGVRSRTARALARAAHPDLSPGLAAASVLNAAAETDGLDPASALRKLQQLAAKRPRDVGLALTMVQVHMQQGHPARALASLDALLAALEASSDGDARFGPGLVALAVALLRLQHREAAAKHELTRAARHWAARPPSSSCPSLLLAAGVELMRSSAADDLALAGACFESILASSSSDQPASPIASAGLVASFAASDAAKAHSHSALLPPVEHLIAGIDVDALLAAGVVVVAAPASTPRKRPADGEQPPSAAKRRRRTRRRPKGFVEGRAPDPERWLPLRDRSSYRPKGRKGKKKAAEATQGGPVKDEETLELVGGGGVRVEKASGASAAAKKKKKGKK